ncbi:helix-turn-helix domain-containing protein [Paenibacillus sinopodophylli]|uniref:helix-turn-helix domain-containing protein n=1 Tax=Paenibacillus sinopodophylli TaxID=1837342 RepID=UPI00110CC065|nr:helix-turn-helix domain-containing protein [Paenibacillus sinopodophylli]
MNKAERQKETDSDNRMDGVWLKLRHMEWMNEQSQSLQPSCDKANCLQFLVAEGNSGQVCIDGQQYPLQPGIIFLCSEEQRIQVKASQSLDTGLFRITFEAGIVPQTEQQDRGNSKSQLNLQNMVGVYKLPDASLAVEKCQKMIRYWNSGNAVDKLYGTAGLYELLGLTLQGTTQSPTSMLELARSEIQKRYAEEIKVDDLAGLVGLSRFHFMRTFKEKYGRGVHEYVTELRVGKAKRLLVEQPALSMQDIASQTGYSSATTFCRTFKKQIGITPTIYWRSRSRRTAAYSWANIGQLLPLQIMPYAAPVDQYWNDFYRKKYVTDVVVPLSHDHVFNLAALREARPDCIIGMDYLIPPEHRKQLEQIAPLLLIPWAIADWRQHLRLVADFTNKSREAESWLTGYDWKAEAVRRQLQPGVKKSVVLILKISGSRISVVGRRAATVLYDDLQLKTPYRLGVIDPWLQVVLPHQLEDFQADHILLSVNEDEDSQAAWRGLLASEYWESLRAVKHRMITYLPGSPWFEFPSGEYSAFHHDRMLDEVQNTQLCLQGSRLHSAASRMD